MHPTLVLNVVGLTPELVGPSTPELARFREQHAARPLRTVTPAVTCSAQSTFLTGLVPRDHGIVANGWYFRELSQVFFWRQSNALVTGDKVWDAPVKSITSPGATPRPGDHVLLFRSSLTCTFCLNALQPWRQANPDGPPASWKPVFTSDTGNLVLYEVQG